MNVVLILCGLVALVNCQGPGILNPVIAHTTLTDKFAPNTESKCKAPGTLTAKCEAKLALGCRRKECVVFHSKGFYGGLEFDFFKSYKFTGIGCWTERATCSNDPKNNYCFCITQFSWQKKRVVIVHNGGLYAVSAWVKMPSGCDCSRILIQ